MTKIPSRAEANAFGFIRRYWVAIVVPFLLVWCFFLFLYSGFKQTLIEEVRNYARFAATVTTFAVKPDDIASIQGPEDAVSDTYRRLQQTLDVFRKTSRDICYVYILRRSSAPQAKPSDYVYVVDLPVEDVDHDGTISDSEKSETPGNPLDASPFPAMIRAWQAPDADKNIIPNPPYPDVLSGYAPIRNAAGQTIAIVGVDITGQTILQKLRAIRLWIFGGGMTVGLLISIIISLYCRYREVLHEVQKMNVELQHKHLQMKELASLRNDLSHMIAHDLRNSLSVVSGCTSYLSNLPAALSETQRHTLQSKHEMLISGSLHEMTVLLEDMLMLAKNESDRLVPRMSPVNLTVLLADAVKRCEVIAHPTGIAVETLCSSDQPIHITADAHLLLRVVDNLIINALKHSPCSGTVQIRVEVSDQRSAPQPWKVRIKVADQGLGVDPAVKDHLFERFSSSDLTPSRTRSIGLGLAFCKMAVEAHKGRIYLEDSLQGSVFVVELP